MSPRSAFRGFPRRTYTWWRFWNDIRYLLSHRADIRAAFHDEHLSRAFIERIMLAVTGVNGCRYCTYYHSRLALEQDIPPEEIQALLAGDLGAVPAEEAIALIYAQHHAETGGRPSPEAERRLEETYGPEVSQHIRILIRMITVGNLSGNTLDAFLWALGFRPGPFEMPRLLRSAGNTIARRTKRFRRKTRQIASAISDYWKFYIRSTLTEQRRRYTVAQAVVLQDGRVLLVKRTDPRVWELPGGGIERGETPAEAVIREVSEETGLQVRVERELGTYQRLGFRPHDSIVFVCTPIGGTAIPGEETVAVQFFPVDRLPWGLLPWYRTVIRDAIQPSGPPRIRRQWLGVGTLLISLLIVLGERLHLLE